MQRMGNNLLFADYGMYNVLWKEKTKVFLVWFCAEF